MLHDFSQAETGWFSPFVTMSLHPGAVFRLQRAQLLSVPWGHCPLLSTCAALLASGWGWLCPLQHSSHAGCSPPAVLLPLAAPDTSLVGAGRMTTSGHRGAPGAPQQLVVLARVCGGHLGAGWGPGPRGSLVSCSLH